MESTRKEPSEWKFEQITRWRVLRLSVLMAVAAALIWWWYRQRPPEPPTLPPIPLEQMEPGVAEAIQVGIERVRKEPQSGRAWGLLGQLLMVHACEKQAEVCFRRAAALDPAEPRWPYLYYQAVRIRDHHEAIPSLERAVELFDQSDPSETAPRLCLVESLLEREKVDEADRQLERVEQLQPNNPRVLFNRAVIHFRHNELQQAVQCFTKIADLPVARKKATAQLAQLYQALQQPDKAAEFDRKTHEAPKDDSWRDRYLEECAALSKGSLQRMQEVDQLEREGHLREAADLLAELAREANHSEIQIRLATNLARQNRFEEALHRLDELAEREPALSQVHYNRGVALYHWGESRRQRATALNEEAALKYRQAIAALRRAIQLKPDMGLAYSFLGLARSRLGEKSPGLADLQEGVRLEPSSLLTHYNLGDALEEDKRYREALEQFQEAQRFAEYPNAKVRRAIARVQEKMKTSQK